MSKSMAVPVTQLAESFSNPIDERKVHRYIARLVRGDAPPPIHVYRRVFDESDEGRVAFLDGHEGVPGEPIYYVTDGHHRALAALHLGHATIHAIVEPSRTAAPRLLRVPRLSDVQLGALQVYIFDPAHEEDAFPGHLEGNTLVVPAADFERARELLIEAANSADASADRYFTNALTAIVSKLSREAQR